jgi:hypothetical protein
MRGTMRAARSILDEHSNWAPAGRDRLDNSVDRSQTPTITQTLMTRQFPFLVVSTPHSGIRGTTTARCAHSHRVSSSCDSRHHSHRRPQRQLSSSESSSSSSSLNWNHNGERHTWQRTAMYSCGGRGGRSLSITCGSGYVQLSFIHTLIHSVIHAFTQSFIHSVIHGCVDSVIHSLSHSFTQSFMDVLTQSFTHSVIHSFSHLCIHSRTHSFTQSFTQSFTTFPHSFTCSARAERPLTSTNLRSRLFLSIAAPSWTTLCCRRLPGAAPRLRESCALVRCPNSTLTALRIHASCRRLEEPPSVKLIAESGEHLFVIEKVEGPCTTMSHAPRQHNADSHAHLIRFGSDELLLRLRGQHFPSAVAARNPRCRAGAYESAKLFDHAHHNPARALPTMPSAA